MPEPIESNAAVIEVGRELLEELRAERRVPARLLGIGLSGLVSADDPRQLGLFDEPVAGESERDRDVSRVVDDLVDRFGDGAILPGRLVRDPEEGARDGSGRTGRSRDARRRKGDDGPRRAGDDERTGP